MLETTLPPLRRLPARLRRGVHRALGIAAAAVLTMRGERVVGPEAVG
jgi:hypothetical protein